MLRNRERDRYATELAQKSGWTVVRVWECVVRSDPRSAAMAVLKKRTIHPIRDQRPTTLGVEPEARNEF